MFCRFELADFYWEAKRILRPGGVLAIWGYDRPFIRGNDKAEALVLEIYSQTFGPYWDKRRFHIDDHLAGQMHEHGMCLMHNSLLL